MLTDNLDILLRFIEKPKSSINNKRIINNKQIVFHRESY